MSAPLGEPPSFDGRLVVYPGTQEIRDYFAWRQADTHINNLYNTIFWALVLQGQKTEREAHDLLKGTVSSEKHEMLLASITINSPHFSAREPHSSGRLCRIHAGPSHGPSCAPCMSTSSATHFGMRHRTQRHLG